MALGLYMDVHVSSAVTQRLRSRGIDVLTSQDDGTREADDAVILHRATELGRLLFSQDEDLLVIAAGFQTNGIEFAGVAYAHQLGPGVGQIVTDLELITLCADLHETWNQVIYLPLP
jgi:hypothetical protein